MRALIVIIIPVILFCSYSSARNQFNTASNINDTTEVIKLSIWKAFDSSSLPDISRVKLKFKFGDSILLTSAKLPIRYLPKQMDTLVFKIMKQADVCKMIDLEPDWEKKPNYLSIQYFKREKNTFTVIIVSHNCGRFVSGGALYLTIVKENGVFKITGRSSYSMG